MTPNLTDLLTAAERIAQEAAAAIMAGLAALPQRIPILSEEDVAGFAPFSTERPSAICKQLLEFAGKQLEDAAQAAQPSSGSDP